MGAAVGAVFAAAFGPFLFYGQVSVDSLSSYFYFMFGWNVKK